jgi:Flp pilus assembly protein TadG
MSGRSGAPSPRRRGEEGVVAIEFAILATLFLIILAGTVNIGFLLYTASELDAAVSAGAKYAENNAALVASNPSALSSDIATVVDNINGSNWASTTVNVNNSNDETGCYCPSGTPQNNWSWGSAQSCGTTCSGGGIAGQFVEITATTTISPLVPTFGFVQNGTLTRSAVVETE